MSENMESNESHSQSERNGDYRGVSDEYPTKHSTTAARIERTAAKLGWNIPEHYKQGIVNRQVQIAISPDSTNRESTSAARVLTAMNGQDIALNQDQGNDQINVTVLAQAFKEIDDSVPVVAEPQRIENGDSEA